MKHIFIIMMGQSWANKMRKVKVREVYVSVKFDGWLYVQLYKLFLFLLKTGNAWFQKGIKNRGFANVVFQRPMFLLDSKKNDPSLISLYIHSLHIKYILHHSLAQHLPLLRHLPPLLGLHYRQCIPRVSFLTIGFVALLWIWDWFWNQIYAADKCANLDLGQALDRWEIAAGNM